MEVLVVPQLADNYGYVLIGPGRKTAAVVDCADARAVAAALRERGLGLEAILSTHHHFDHVAGNLELLREMGPVPVYGSDTGGERVPGLTEAMGDGAEITVAESLCRVLHIPAHTSGHVAYFFPEAGPALFCGDTLFLAGCGRLFEGSPEQMLASLSKLAALPDATLVYCGHEYTEKNLAFALTLEPSNARLRAKFREVQWLRRLGKPTVPSTIGEEKEINPFLRWNSDEIKASIEQRFPGAKLDPVSVLARTRELKDTF